MRLLRILLALWLVSLSPAFAALEIKSPRWGFGGKILLGTFNVLSFEVKNTGAQPFDGTISLRQGGDAAPCVQPLFVAPGTARWVQFAPYIERYVSDYSVVCTPKSGGRDESVTIEARRSDSGVGLPLTVVLADPGAVGTTKLPVFPEDLFPATVSETDSLHAVILDHSPRFPAPAQREAFLDWVKLGGIVHLVPGPAGKLPEFPPELASLNVAGGSGRVGAGLVVKHAEPVAEVGEEQLQNWHFPNPVKESYRDPSENYNGYSRYESDGTGDAAFFQILSAVTKPSIAWWLIYLLTIIYIGIIGPVFFFLRKRDYRVLLVSFLGTIALFAWLFTYIGRRGYGERQVCHSVLVARAMGEGRYDVCHWSHAFATSGAVYHLAYPGNSQLYAAEGAEGETVRGQVNVGHEASFDADIPLFSFRNFLHRGVMAGPDLSAQLASSSDPSKPGWPRELKITLAAEVPGSVIRAAVWMDGRFYEADVNGREVTLPRSDARESSVLRVNQGSEYDYYYYYRTMSPDEARRHLRNVGTSLALRAGSAPKQSAQFFGRAPRRDTLRLFVFTRAPGLFRMSGDEFATGENYVLFVQDLPLPAASLSP